MNPAIKILPHYNYEDYCNWEGRWELIDGIPYAMSPAPVPEHQRLVMSLGREFINALKKSKCKNCKVYDFIDIKISEDIILQPDVLIVSKPITKNFLDFPPLLIAEILSPATAFKDRHVKFSLYEQMSIKYFLIIDIDKKSIEINTLTSDKYVITTPHGSEAFTFTAEDGCSFNVVLTDIWE